MDDITRRVVDMYSQYPYPLVGTHQDMFKELVYPFIIDSANVGSILEVGCGTGNVAIAIAQLLPYARVVGIDVADEPLRIARESASLQGVRNVEFRHSNLLDFETEIGTFDFVHCQGVIHHLSDPGRGMANLYRYLNPGRYAYIWLYMLLGRRWIRDIQEVLNLLGTSDLPYEDRIEWTDRVLRVWQSKKRPDGLKRYHPEKPAEKLRTPDEKPLNSQTLRLTERAIHLLNESGWQALFHAIGRRYRRKGRITESVPGSRGLKIDAKLEERRDKAGMTDMYLHPHDLFFRMSEILNLFRGAGFADIRISDGMSRDLEQCLGDDFPEIRKIVSTMSINQQYEFMELVEKPSGVGFFLRKPR